jgi:hypothetical protein
MSINPVRDQYTARAIGLAQSAGETIDVPSVSRHLPEKFGLDVQELMRVKRELESAAAPESTAVPAAPETAVIQPEPVSSFSNDDWREALEEQQAARVGLMDAQRRKANTQGRLIEARQRIAQGAAPTGPTELESIRAHLAASALDRARLGPSRGRAEKMRRQPVWSRELGRFVRPGIGGHREGYTYNVQGETNYDPARGPTRPEGNVHG